jgi:hypothetical protein
MVNVTVTVDLGCDASVVWCSSDPIPASVWGEG